METDPECVTADGGTSTITNQDEAAILADTIADVSLVVLPGGEDDFSHVSPQFREPAVGSL
jgi:hypothetical protein